MNRQDRARRVKRMTARRLGKAQRARDRGHRTGGVANHAVQTVPLDTSQRQVRYGSVPFTPRQARRIRHKASRAFSAGAGSR